MNENDITACQPLFADLPIHPEEPENDWTYTMRRQMQEIVPGVFLGPYAVATRRMLPYLQENHITHIVCVRHPVEDKTIKPSFPDVLQYLIIDLADKNPECMIPSFSKVKRFIDQCLEFGGKALIHGNTGISASAAIAIAFVMEKYGITSHEALQVVQRQRFCINPNESLKRQLYEYQVLYLARRQISRSHPFARAKRVKEEIDEEVNFAQPFKRGNYQTY